LGDAAKESLIKFGYDFGGWYDDYTSFPYPDYNWFRRSGIYNNSIRAGIFGYRNISGATYTFTTSRAILVRN